jgi:hypothetical protein
LKPLAPIILFVHNRPEHTEKTVNALKLADLAEQSDLHIFADGPTENKDNQEKVKAVSEYIHGIVGFNNVIIHENEKNEGLASSIINGIDQVLKNSNSVITIEDDVIVGKYFLHYMNEALKRYEEEKNVFMISGYGFNLPFNGMRKKAFFLPTGSTQAWGTWKRVWNQIDFEAKGYEDLKNNKKIRRRFNLHGGIDYSTMLINQMESDGDMISSWAIRFRWTLFKLKGLTLFPPHNLIHNTGWDGSGKHSGTENPYHDNIKNIDKKVHTFQKKVRVKKTNLGILVLFFYKIKLRGYLKKKLR